MRNVLSVASLHNALQFSVAIHQVRDIEIQIIFSFTKLTFAEPCFGSLLVF